MTLTSELIAVRQLRRGDSVGYGCAFTADTPMRVGIVACGYADRYPRHAPTRTPILVRGKRPGTVGRLANERPFADPTGIPQTAVRPPRARWRRGAPARRGGAKAAMAA